MRTALITDSPYVATGFGVAAKKLIPYLVSSGIEITQLGIYHFDEVQTEFHAMKIIPVSFRDSMGLNRLKDLITIDPEVILIIHELMYVGVWAGALRSLGFQKPIVGFIPVYGPHLSEREMTALRLIDVPISFSNYGSDVIRGYDINCSTIHLGVDHDLFRPISDLDRKVERRRLGWNDTFVFTYIARNRWNKQQPKLISAARILIDMGITDFRIYIHCVPRAGGSHWVPGMGMLLQEWDLEELRRELDVSQYVLFPEDLESQHKGIDEINLVSRLQSSDCVAHVAHGEGFGLPLVESLSCAVPVACTADGRVMQEVVGDAGILVDTDHMLEDSNGNYFKDVQPDEWAHVMADIYQEFQNEKSRYSYSEKSYSRGLLFDWKKTALELTDRIRKAESERSDMWHYG